MQIFLHWIPAEMKKTTTTMYGPAIAHPYGHRHIEGGMLADELTEDVRNLPDTSKRDDARNQFMNTWKSVIVTCARMSVCMCVPVHYTCTCICSAKRWRYISGWPRPTKVRVPSNQLQARNHVASHHKGFSSRFVATYRGRNTQRARTRSRPMLVGWLTMSLRTEARLRASFSCCWVRCKVTTRRCATRVLARSYSSAPPDDHSNFDRLGKLLSPDGYRSWYVVAERIYILFCLLNWYHRLFVHIQSDFEGQNTHMRGYLNSLWQFLI